MRTPSARTFKSVADVEKKLKMCWPRYKKYLRFKWVWVEKFSPLTLMEEDGTINTEGVPGLF